MPFTGKVHAVDEGDRVLAVEGDVFKAGVVKLANHGFSLRIFNHNSKALDKRALDAASDAEAPAASIAITTNRIVHFLDSPDMATSPKFK